MVRITDDMTEAEYERALDLELEGKRLKYGDESRMFEKGYDYRPDKISIFRPNFFYARSIQEIVNRL